MIEPTKPTVPPDEPDDSQSTVKREPMASASEVPRESMSVMGTAPPIGPRETPDWIGEYELLEEVARGGMGVVFKARHERLQRLVALKMILYGHLANEDSRQRFHLEAAAVAQLQHPGIVAIYEVGSHEGQPYFTMEFVEGLSLEQRLKEGPLPGRQAAEYLETTARAVHFAHLRRILHRDLKPANILIDEQHNPKVTDFGLAKVLEDDSQQTRTGAIMGTPSYMAPEQALARKDLGPSCDVYALGAILYEVLTGRPPFQGETPMATMTMVIEQEPVAPRLLNPHVDPDLETICLKCLEKSPHRRYLSAEQFANDLRNFLDGRPIHARRTGKIGRGLKWCRRNPALAALVVVSVLASLALFSGGLAFGIVQQRLRREAEQSRIEADNNAHDARRAERAARLAERRATSRYEAFHHLFYVTQFRLARNVWEAGNRARALEWLDVWQKTYKDVRDPRGWEWYYLRQLCQGKSVIVLPNRRVTGMVFDRDGQHLVTADDGGDLHWWKLATGRPAKIIHVSDFSIRALAFSPDGKTLATASGERAVNSGTIHIWDVATGKSVVKIDASSPLVQALAFSPDGKTLAAGCDDNSIKLYSAESGRPLSTLEGHAAPVRLLRYSASGLLTSAAGKEILLWSLRADAKPVRLEHDEEVRDFAYYKNTDRLLVICKKDEIYFWDAAKGAKLTISHLGVQQNSALARDGSLIASCDPQADVVIRLISGKEARYTENFRSHWYMPSVSLMALSPGNQRLACATDEGTIWIGYTMGGQEVYAQAGHKEPVRALAFSPARGQLISAGEDGVRFWGGSDNGRLLGVPKGLSALAVSPRGDLLALAQRDHRIRILDGKSLDEIAVLKGHDGIVRSLSFSRDGKLIATGGDDETVRLWDVRTGKALGSWKGHNGPVVAVAFSPKGDQIASGASSDDVVRLWNLKGQSVLLRGHTNGVVALAFHPSGSHLASGGYDKTIRLWNLKEGTSSPLEGHGKVVNCLAFNPKGIRLASGAGDQTVRIWDFVTRQELLKLDAGELDVTCIAFSPQDGRQLAAGGHDRLIRIWETDPP